MIGYTCMERLSTGERHPPDGHRFGAFRLPLNLAATARSKLRRLALAATWSITALSKKTRVPAATLRYWEHLGLLPRAARTHTGYRMFAGEVLQYVEFVRRSKAIGLSLRQMRRVLDVARTGGTPCPEVEEWIRERLVKRT